MLTRKMIVGKAVMSSPQKCRVGRRDFELPDPDKLRKRLNRIRVLKRKIKKLDDKQTFDG